MRHGLLPSLGAVVLAAVLSGCPSLDGFVGDGGADGGFNQSGFIPLDEAVKFCSKALTCVNLGKSTLTSLHVPVDANNFAGCVSWLAGTIPQDRPGIALSAKALMCAADASSCSTASACMWFEYISPSDPRCVGYSGGANGQCSPTKTATYLCPYGFIAHCDNPFNYTGSSCLQSSSGQFFCAVSSGLCSNPDSGTAPTPCSGSFFTYCQGGLLVGFDCNVQGMDCASAGCSTNGTYTPCTGAAVVTCGANKRVEVCDGLLQSEINCDTMGGTCAVSGTNLPRCTTPADTCSPYDSDENLCSGDVISLCVGGQKLTYDCTKVGLHCKDGSGSLSGHCE